MSRSDLLSDAGSVLASLRGWIAQHADRRTVETNQVQESYVHDFLSFTVTKASRSLEAAIRLLEADFNEDALVLARAAYECYLHEAFIATHPDRVDDVLISKVGAYLGAFEHPVTKSGRPKWREVVDPATGESYSHGIPLGELVNGTRHDADAAVHPQLYGFLSEYAHVHFIVLGAYVTHDFSRFSSKPAPHQRFSATLFVSYIAWLIATETNAIAPIEGRANSGIDSLRIRLLDALSSPVDGPLSDLPEAMRRRLNS